jgi:chromate transport protein ChrA
LLGAGVAVLADALGISVMLRRLLAVLVAAALAAAMVVWLESFSTVPAVSAVAVAAFGAVMAIVALAVVDVLADESRRRQEQLVVGPTTDVAVTVTPLRVVMPIVVAAPVTYVLGRILVEYASR